MLRSRLVLGGVLAALAFAGCGGDDAEKADTAKASAKPPGFVAKADAICAEANKQERALGAVEVDWIYHEPFSDPEFLAEFTAIGASAVEQLQRLKPPPGDEKLMAAMLSAITRMVTVLEERTADLRSGKDKHHSEQMNAYLTGYSDLAVAAGPLGLTECQGLVL